YPDIIYVIIHDDDFFAHDTAWLKRFADDYNNLIHRRFICCGTPRTITAEKIRILKSCGLSWVFIGLQSGSSRTKKDIYKRSVTNEALMDVARITHDCKIAPLYDVILDNPFEAEEDLLETVRLILKLPKPFQFQLYSLTFYEGTEIHRMATERGLHIENPCEKNYFHYKRSFFNKIIRLCPLLPRPVISFIVTRRNAAPTKVLLNVFYPLAIILLEPLVWWKLILVSFDYNIGPAITMTRAFIKTGVRKLILRQSA
ncbi:MAG: radical SAM protein, partial [bacterium]